MPYISEPARDAIDPAINQLVHALSAWGPGELNYAITRLAIRFLYNGLPNYERRSLTLAQMEAAKLEFYRRAVAPYEDKKIAQNGDVYPKED